MSCQSCCPSTLAAAAASFAGLPIVGPFIPEAPSQNACTYGTYSTCGTPIPCSTYLCVGNCDWTSKECKAVQRSIAEQLAAFLVRFDTQVVVQTDVPALTRTAWQLISRAFWQVQQALANKKCIPSSRLFSFIDIVLQALLVDPVLPPRIVASANELRIIISPLTGNISSSTCPPTRALSACSQGQGPCGPGDQCPEMCAAALHVLAAAAYAAAKSLESNANNVAVGNFGSGAIPQQIMQQGSRILLEFSNAISLAACSGCCCLPYGITGSFSAVQDSLSAAIVYVPTTAPNLAFTRLLEFIGGMALFTAFALPVITCPVPPPTPPLPPQTSMSSKGEVGGSTTTKGAKTKKTTSPPTTQCGGSQQQEGCAPLIQLLERLPCEILQLRSLVAQLTVLPPPTA